jgi:hypothetical protein
VAEGVFSPRTSFEPIEYIAALQCHEWLTSEEKRGLALRAYAAAIAETTTGRIVHVPEQYIERLQRTAELGPADFGPAEPEVPSTRASSGGIKARSRGRHLETGPWANWTRSVRSQRGVGGDDDPETARFAAEISRFTGPSSAFAVRLATWGWVNARIEQELEAAASAWPESDAGELPIIRNRTLEDGRAVRLADLWRRYLTATGPAKEAGRRQLDEFLESERRLEAGWEASRRRVARPYLRRALHYATFAAEFLPTIVSPAELAEPHPVIRGLHDAISTDCRALVDRLREQIATIEAALRDETTFDLGVPG